MENCLGDSEQQTQIALAPGLCFPDKRQGLLRAVNLCLREWLQVPPLGGFLLSALPCNDTQLKHIRHADNGAKEDQGGDSNSGDQVSRRV